MHLENLGSIPRLKFYTTGEARAVFLCAQMMIGEVGKGFLPDGITTRKMASRLLAEIIDGIPPNCRHKGVQGQKYNGQLLEHPIVTKNPLSIGLMGQAACLYAVRGDVSQQNAYYEDPDHDLTAHLEEIQNLLEPATSGR